MVRRFLRGKKIAGIMSVFDLKEGAIVAKIGRSTGYTEGVVTSVSMDDLTVLYHGTGNPRFDGLIEVSWKGLRSPFARPGDSGSLVFDPTTMKAVGLHFAGGEIRRSGKRTGVSYCCDITSVRDSLGCKLVE
jgi:hypothetical protein